MEFFSMLGVSTVVIVVLTLALYRKRRDAGCLVGMAALYYWTLYGAWYIVIDKTISIWSTSSSPLRWTTSTC
ncbi:MAG: hypothetical protein ABSF12_16525 [Bryobacteraceae bacterium]